MKRFIRVFGALLTATLLSVTPYSSVLAGDTVSGDYDYRTSDYRFYENADNLIPGTPLADTNTPATLQNTGDSFRLRAGIKSEMGWKSVAPQDGATCAIGSDDRAYCWGSRGGSRGQLGDGLTSGSAILPQPVYWSGVLAGKTAKYIASGWSFSCVVTADDSMACWGDNWAGQLGNGTVTSSSIPVAVSLPPEVVSQGIRDLRASTNDVCVITHADKLYCWGQRAGSTTPSLIDSGDVLAESIDKIAASSSHACVLTTSSRVACWGENAWGQLGNGTTTYTAEPTNIDQSGALAGKTIIDVTVVSGASCALTSEGRVYCWGSGSNTTHTNDSLVPREINYGAMTAGEAIRFYDVINMPNNACLETLAGPYCWGENWGGQLATGDNNSPEELPVAAFRAGLPDGESITNIYTGQYHSCALTQQENIFCSGANWSYELGNADPNRADGLTLQPVVSTGPQISASQSSLRLEYAPRTATACEAQTTGFTPVTTSSRIAFNLNSSINTGDAITAQANDPLTSPFTTSQIYIEDGTSFTNPNTIDPATYGLWDFSLTDKSAKSNTTYCLRIAYADGTPLERYGDLPEITTAQVLAANIASPTIAKVTWQGSKPVITGTYDARNMTDLEVTINGRSYTLSTSSFFTASGDSWILDLTSSSDPNDTFMAGEYKVEVLGTTTGGDSLSDSTTTALGGPGELANTGIDTIHIIGLSLALMIAGFITTAYVMRNKRITL